MQSVKKTAKINYSRVFLVLILILSAFLTVFKIWKLGYSNEFYAASVKSMLTSWKNFFFVSLDPGGWVTVDKPPVSLWVEAAFAKIFGFYGWSLILPNCLAAVGTVWILYRTVRRPFGETAGLISALVLALSPVFIVISKTNNTDSILIFFMVCSAWAMFRAVEEKKTGYLILSMVFLGVAYNAKSLEAYLILPALAAAFLFVPGMRLRKKLLSLGAGLLVLAAVSLSWSAAVDLTPAENRPYVDNSSSNSELELAFQYNGVERIFGQMRNFFGGGSGNGNPDFAGGERPSGTLREDGDRASLSSGGNPDGGAPGRGAEGREGTSGLGNPGGAGLGNGMFNGGGEPGALRLFNTTLGGQDDWLLPFGLFSILAFLVSVWKDKERKNRGKLISALLFWGGSTLTMAVYFSVSEFFHPYYLSVMAPFLAALCGIGFSLMGKLYPGKGASGFLLPAALAVTAAVEAVMLKEYAFHEEILIPAVLSAAGIPALILTLLRVLPRTSAKAGRGKLSAVLAGIAFAGLLTAPAVWTGYSVANLNFNAVIPTAGPSAGESAGRGMRTGGVAGGEGAAPEAGQERSDGNTELIRFLEQNNTGEKFLVAVPSASEAEPIILSTGKPVMAVGGFSGTTRTLTVTKLKSMVESGEIRYYLLGGEGGRGGGTDEVSEWVRKNGKLVDSSKWSSGNDGSEGNRFAGMSSSRELYDLSALRKTD